jgi:hypothetical protein
MRKKITIFVFALFCSASLLLNAQNMEGVVKQTKQVQTEGTKLQARESHTKNTTREITLMEDRDQSYMTTKVYDIKNTKASDLTPFVEGAVKRANESSTVGNLFYKKENKNFLSVSMPNYMVPYIDDMIKKLDRPGIKDSSDSVVAGTGIHHFYYSPNYRSTDEMLKVLFARFTNGDTNVFRGAGSNFFYWKGSTSDGKTLGNWLKAMDRPLPQMQVRIKIYQISVSDLKELGIDWVAFKNGPGAELFGVGMDMIKNHSFTDFSNMMDFSSLSSFTNPGFFIAPNIDMTFLRLLAQKGKAKVATSAYLTVINDQNNNIDRHGNVAWSPFFVNSRYRIKFNPVFQTITKSNDQYQEVQIVSRQPSLTFFISAPVILFDNAEMSNQAAIMNFNWNVAIENEVSESTHTGDLVQDNFYFGSYAKLRANSEKLIATYVKRHKVNQNNGVPFLGDIPVLKYVFGATTDSWKDFRYYVTVEAEPADPMDSTWSQWAGKLVTAEDMLTSPLESKKVPLREEWSPAEDILPSQRKKQ